MNKAQLVDALTARLGDRRTAAAAVDGVVDVIVETVGAGDSVTLTGFGVFEARRRAARVARNPRTGETVPVPETVVPSFRAGAAFRDRIGDSDAAAAGATSAPRRPPRPSTRVTGSAAGEPAAGKPGAKAGTAKPAAKKKSTAGASAADKAATAKGATAKSPASKPAAAKSTKSSTKGTSTAKKAPSRRSTAEK